ncbi:MAG: toll/interleukin-1 receptor domain-containing protein [Synergistaceae bacterium]|nr:toll/interleukin-1 receptor domain-containing protein [Synergistaceae bacterium]MBQ3346240.1 toll/interleukin-1 receptor domain-containing protein [Synergistaceae bacterium]MBQ3758148.1 toll/interleukin-1 receptor domain-containing protein [Synergistaceae bacterium]MBQ6115288.1 toll/interleukin-1 receptor domain-containing protein [Synergistaceae bacterium]MBQ6418361.1 toll/interleukin-1 receptor domain-containing protein [Synergistaceae bacterium]
METETSFKYYAFISYSHKDQEIAHKLQKHLEKYHLSSSLKKSNPGLPKKLSPIFIDTSDLIGKGTLKSALQENLDNSNYLIVICSPNSAKSPYVNDEVEYFVKAGRVEHIIPLIIDGAPHSNDPELECFPPALLALPRENELLGIDLKKYGSHEAFIRVIATLLRLDINYFVSRDARERKRKLFLFVSMLMALLIASIIMRPKPYDEVLADKVMESSLSGYVRVGRQWKNFRDLVYCAANNPENFNQQLKIYKDHFSTEEAARTKELLQYLYDMMKSGSVMPWSGKPIAQRVCAELIALYGNREIQYKFFASVLEFTMNDLETRRDYGSQYIGLLMEILELDANIASTLFQIVCVPHLTGKYADNSATAQKFAALLSSVPEQNEHLHSENAKNADEHLVLFKEERGDCLMRLNSCGVFNAYSSQIRGK